MKDSRMIDLMVDLETLDTIDTAVILSIGIIDFLEIAPLHLALDGRMQPERTTSVDTAIWWSNQSESAKGAAFGGSLSPIEAIDALTGYVENWRRIEGVSGVRLWGNGIMFDNAILRNFYKTYGAPVPWTYREDMDYRTLKNVFDPAGKLWPGRVGEHHNALDDARTQARHAVAIFNNIINGSLYPPFVVDVGDLEQASKQITGQ